jgi:Flp pilus assembly pilin Flp
MLTGVLSDREHEKASFSGLLQERRQKTMFYAPEENGQGLVEYALIIAFIAVLVLMALGWVTGGLNSIFSRIAVYL